MVYFPLRIFSDNEWIDIFDEDDNWKPPTPASNARIWRYRSLDRYVTLLDESSLWFSRADEFDDQYEGSLPEATFVRWIQKLRQLGLNYQEIYRYLQQLTYLNCWHENTSESFAMWDLYLEDGQGIAIISTPERLNKALQINHKEYVAGDINYIDYLNDDFNINSSVTPFFHKRESFRHEREYRILHRTKKETPEGGISPNKMGDYYSKGISIPVDLEELIEEVRISPEAEDGLQQKIENETRDRGFEFPINPSELTGEAIF